MNPLASISNVSFITAFTAGLLTFFSPCILPLLPSYFSLISNKSAREIKEADNKFGLVLSVVKGTLLFGLGFSLVFILLGASATYLGHFLVEYRRMITLIGGILIIIMGILLSGVIPLSFFNSEKRIHLRVPNKSPLFPFLFGLVFAFGWTPCIGPVLSSILIIASSLESITQGIFLLLVFSSALILMFLIFGILFTYFFQITKVFQKFGKWVKIISSALLVFYGFYFIFTGF